MNSETSIQEFGPEVLLAFIGHSQDAEKEAKAIYALENEFQRELERLNRPGDRVNRFRFWEWNYDARPKPGGQEGVINPYLKRADIAVFIFKEKIGEVTWEELELCRQRKDGSFYVLPLFPQNPPPDLDLTSLEGTKSWLDLLTKKKDLAKDWTSPSSKSLTPIENYRDGQHLEEIIREQVKKIIPAILKAQHSKQNRPAEKPSQKSPVPLQIPDAYANWLIKRCQDHDINKLVDSRDSEVLHSIKMPQLFIPLYGDPTWEKRDGLEIHEKTEPVDIEELAARNDYLVVKGQAGSGKTTLMKHLAYSIINRENVHGLNEYLPLLLILNDLQTILKEEDRIIGAPMAERFLAAYFQEEGNSLDMETVNAFCNAGKAIFLLDGLDETDPESRKKIVGALFDFRKNNKIVLCGRPHGIDGIVSQKFSDRLVEINNLNDKQIAEFIEKWFRYDEKLSREGKTPQGMINEIRILEESHKDMKKLLETPLMLMAICILYHYDRKLPDQRVELYEKFVGNLIHKRCQDPKKVENFLMRLAFEVHQSEAGKKKEDRSRKFDKSFALNILKDFFPENEGKTGQDYMARINEKFDEIEQNCGLLRVDNRQYLFWHLSFQAFLAARYIQNTSANHVVDIKKYWNSDNRDWYEEIVKLFIASLSYLNYNGAAHGVVDDLFAFDDQSPFGVWRLAGMALLDIHKDHRIGKTENLARERLKSIFQFETDPKALAEAGETLGWLGDPRPLEEFVEIEEGEYDLGEELGRVNIASFGIGKYPVTNRWFEKFILAGGYREEIWGKYWTPEGRKWLKENKPQTPEYWHERKWNCPNAPVVGVSWWEADAFCRWLTDERKDGFTYRLPTEQEWQAAAAGKKKREYPWGEWEEGRCNSGECGIGKTSAVGIFERGNTPEGVADMSGNVWEWTQSDYDSKQAKEDFVMSDFRPVLRGGSWIFEAFYCRCAYRDGYHPDYRYYGVVGFRCARTLTL